MTTEDLEKKLKISNYTCIHCPTLELAKQVLNIFHQLGLRWNSETSYVSDHNWNAFKGNTLYYPFEGGLSALGFANLTGYKVISAKEFIALHTEGEEFDLENYEPRGDLQGFPKEIISHMLNYQEEQGNERNVTIFEKCIEAGMDIKGFFWNDTKEKFDFWKQVIRDKNFNLFFEKYPKQEYQELKNNKNMQENNKKEDNSQEFRIGDKVIDILLYEVGVVHDIDYSPNIPYGLSVKFKSGLKSYTINGCYIPEYKNPHLLHYRDNYDYSIIDFNNLPKRQEPPKRWRAEKGETYYRFTSNFEVKGFYDDNDCSDNVAYDSGNYFKTKEEAQEVEDKLYKYFQELINPTKELWQKN